MRIVGILLAAGTASRFGGDKLKARLAGGVPVGVQSARNLALAVSEVIAVVRPGDAELERLLGSTGVRVEPCAAAVEGMGASLAHGVRASADADGWIVALADMPTIAPATLRAVAEALAAGAAIVAPAYRGTRGHPVGFGAQFSAELAALSGDAGARALLHANRARVRLIEVDDPGVLADIDTPEDLARLAGRGP